MLQGKIRNLQRYVRASLSVFFNKKEKLDSGIKKIIEEVFQVSNSYLKLNKNSRKKTHKIFSNKVLRLIKKKKFLNFLQLSFIQQMFFVHNRLYLFSYLREMKKSKKWKFWKKLILESNVGNPVRYFIYPKSSGNKIFQTYHLKKYEEFCKYSLKKFEYIIEFGGGYGNMAVTFKKINPNIKFIVFDTFEVNLLQYYYIKRHNLNVNLNIKDNISSIDLVNKLNILKSKIFKIKTLRNKLLIANWSISETPLKFRDKIYFLFKEFDYQLISFQKNFEEINNMKYFSEILKLNKKKNRLTNIFPIKKMHNHFYLFSKI